MGVLHFDSIQHQNAIYFAKICFEFIPYEETTVASTVGPGPRQETRHQPSSLPSRKSHPDRINIDPAKYSCETRVVNFGLDDADVGLPVNDGV